MTNTLFLLAFATVPLLAGPPLICHRIDIGDAGSLPWTNAQGWDGARRDYDVAGRLVTDTLALLDAASPINVRMETMRRASIYAARDAALAAELAAKLRGRAESRNTALAWFDAGYWIESVRQASFIYRFEMLSEKEKPAWQIRKGLPGQDGYPLVKKAIAMGGAPGMERALELIDEYRRADSRFALKE
jgi:hypothetical protein